jgi:predicted secreted Zn-dependent protease
MIMHVEEAADHCTIRKTKIDIHAKIILPKCSRQGTTIKRKLE